MRQQEFYLHVTIPLAGDEDPTAGAQLCEVLAGYLNRAITHAEHTEITVVEEGGPADAAVEH